MTAYITVVIPVGHIGPIDLLASALAAEHITASVTAQMPDGSVRRYAGVDGQSPSARQVAVHGPQYVPISGLHRTRIQVDVPTSLLSPGHRPQPPALK